MNNIQKIQEDFFTNNGSFMDQLWGKHYFDLEQFQALILTLKKIKRSKIKLFDSHFSYFLIHNISLILYMESDVRIGYYDLNITFIQFSEYNEELIYEIKSLFNDEFIKDFHGNLY